VSSDRHGTSGYRAPEFFDETPSFNNKLDIWSMGCILYELVVGKKAFATDHAVFSYRQNASMINVPLESRAFDTDSKERITQSICSMLQITPTHRPSAAILVQRFGQYSRPLIFQPELAEEETESAEEMQPWEWAEEQAVKEAIRRSLGQHRLGWAHAMEMQAKTERARRTVEHMIILVNQQRREEKRLAEIQKLGSDDQFGIFVSSERRVVRFKIDSSTTIKEVKQKIKDRDVLGDREFELLYRGRAQNDNRSVAECGIPNCSVVELILKCRWISPWD
jgi:serine/threonine protein kinase